MATKIISEISIVSMDHYYGTFKFSKLVQSFTEFLRITFYILEYKGNEIILNGKTLLKISLKMKFHGFILILISFRCVYECHLQSYIDLSYYLLVSFAGQT